MANSLNGNKRFEMIRLPKLSSAAKNRFLDHICTSIQTVATPRQTWSSRNPTTGIRIIGRRFQARVHKHVEKIIHSLRCHVVAVKVLRFSSVSTTWRTLRKSASFWTTENITPWRLRDQITQIATCPVANFPYHAHNLVCGIHSLVLVCRIA